MRVNEEYFTLDLTACLFQYLINRISFVLSTNSPSLPDQRSIVSEVSAEGGCLLFAVFLCKPHYHLCSLDCDFFEEAFLNKFFKVYAYGSCKIVIQQGTPCRMVSNLLELHGQGLPNGSRCARLEKATPGDASPTHCYRQLCFMLASGAVTEVMKAASELFSCQKGEEWDLQWEVKLNLLVIKRMREMCWKQLVPMRPLGCSPKQIAVSVEYQLLSPSNCRNQVWSWREHESPLNFLISGGQVFKIFLDAFPQRFLPAVT